MSKENQNSASSGSASKRPFDVYLPGSKDKEPEFLVTAIVEEERGFLTQESRAMMERLKKAVLNERKYFELLNAVESKFPMETRHETALRFIRDRENYWDAQATQMRESLG